MLPALSPQRRWFVVGLLGVVAMIVVFIAITALRTDPATPRAADVPVILVHGYGGTPASMGTLASALKHEGRTVTTVALPQHGEAEISREARGQNHREDFNRTMQGPASFHAAILRRQAMSGVPR
jgi:triacylglycerol lipase